MPHNDFPANGVEDPDGERTPLLADPRKPPDDSSIESTGPAKADLRIVLPALMVCAFLAAFDVTVVAAIYPIMYISCFGG